MFSDLELPQLHSCSGVTNPGPQSSYKRWNFNLIDTGFQLGNILVDKKAVWNKTVTSAEQPNAFRLKRHHLVGFLYSGRRCLAPHFLFCFITSQLVYLQCWHTVGAVFPFIFLLFYLSAICNSQSTNWKGPVVKVQLRPVSRRAAQLQEKRAPVGCSCVFVCTFKGQLHLEIKHFFWVEHQ